MRGFPRIERRPSRERNEISTKKNMGNWLRQPVNVESQYCSIVCQMYSYRGSQVYVMDNCIELDEQMIRGRFRPVASIRIRAELPPSSGILLKTFSTLTLFIPLNSVQFRNCAFRITLCLHITLSRISFRDYSSRSITSAPGACSLIGTTVFPRADGYRFETSHEGTSLKEPDELPRVNARVCSRLSLRAGSLLRYSDCERAM